jgi:hypothetical protein
VSESEFEPVPGLPEHLPQGERILWQGAPHWLGLALTAFRLRAIAIYFAALMVWRAVSVWHDGGALAEALAYAFDLAPLALAGLGLLLVIAVTAARTTIYTITDKRVVMRFGMALPLTVNIPFSQVDGASFARHGGEAGDVALAVRPEGRIGYLMMWPHVRPWRYARPEPMLRALPDAARAAVILSDALAAHAGAPARPLPQPVSTASAPDMRGAPAPAAS